MVVAEGETEIGLAVEAVLHTKVVAVPLAVRFSELPAAMALDPLAEAGPAPPAIRTEGAVVIVTALDAKAPVQPCPSFPVTL